MSSKNESPWGKMLPYSGDDEKPDPIKELIKEYDKIKEEEWNEDETLGDFKDKQKKRLQSKEKEIWDAIYMKNMKVAP